LRKPLEVEVRMLCEIASISPERSDYHAMEMNNLPLSPFHTLCAHSAFPFLVNLRLNGLREALKAIGKSSQLSLLNEDQARGLDERTSELSRRAYYQHSELYPKDTLLVIEEEEELFGVTRETSMETRMHTLATGFGQEQIHQMQQVGYASHNRDMNVNMKSCISSLLCSSSINFLAGVARTATLADGPRQCLEALLRSSEVLEGKIPFHDLWLNLYALARKVFQKHRHMKNIKTHTNKVTSQTMSIRKLASTSKISMGVLLRVMMPTTDGNNGGMHTAWLGRMHRIDSRSIFGRNGIWVAGQLTVSVQVTRLCHLALV
jgi:hypothetical protein